MSKLLPDPSLGPTSQTGTAPPVTHRDPPDAKGQLFCVL